MEPKLVVRKFKIEHDANEYHYFIEWVMTERGNKWAIRSADAFYLRANYVWDYQGHDTLLYDTPEEALEGWKKYIEARGK